MKEASFARVLLATACPVRPAVRHSELEAEHLILDFPPNKIYQETKLESVRDDLSPAYSLLMRGDGRFHK